MPLTPWEDENQKAREAGSKDPRGWKSESGRLDPSFREDENEVAGCGLATLGHFFVLFTVDILYIIYMLYTQLAFGLRRAVYSGKPSV